jgi:hypothetical protein
VPTSFGLGLIFPIPKNHNHSNHYKLDEFRGITVSPVVSKVFEHCLYRIFSEFLISSPNQFGFKKGKGTRDAIFTLCESVTHFVDNDSTVNICTLDISKAFDKINHHALFIKLMKRKVPFVLIQILINWYSKCLCQVRWESALSKSFSLDRGIRQGGILSPYLFAIYVDDALITLVNSGIGCNLFGLNVGALMYADDIVLIAASIHKLQKLLNLTENCFLEINLKFNVKKCMAMRIGNRHKIKCVNMKMGDEEIPWVHEIKYLGVVFSQASYVKVNLHTNKVKFFYTFNGIFAKIGSARNVDTITQLMRSNCLCHLVFNLESVQITKTDLNNLQFPLYRAFMKIFNVRDKANIAWCQFYMRQLPINYLLDYRKVKYYKKLSLSDCYLMQHLYNNIARGHLNEIYVKYGLEADATVSKLLSTLWSRFQLELV